MRSCLPSPKRCRSISPSVGGKSITRLCARTREVFARSLTVGVLPRFFRFVVTPVLAPASSYLSAAQRIADKYLHRLPFQSGCFSLPREYPEIDRARTADSIDPLNRLPARRTLRSESSRC